MIDGERDLRRIAHFFEGLELWVGIGIGIEVGGIIGYVRRESEYDMVCYKVIHAKYDRVL